MISNNQYKAVTIFSNGFFYNLFINNNNFQELFATPVALSGSSPAIRFK